MMRSGAVFTLLFLALAGCKNPETKNPHPVYFDLAGYFKKEAAKQASRKHPVLKKVVQNGKEQRKKVSPDWPAEFSLFSQSDINKPAWRGSYTVTKNGDFLIYIAKTPDLRTRRIVVKKNGGKISYILISNVVNNALYNSVERLTYFPDSLYRIEKKQQVRILGQNHYLVEGRIQ